MDADILQIQDENHQVHKVESLARRIGDLLKQWSVPSPRNVARLWQCDINQAKELLEEWAQAKRFSVD